MQYDRPAAVKFSQTIIKIMDAIQLALKEDNRTAMAFLISIVARAPHARSLTNLCPSLQPGLLLCCAGLHYTPARIFYCNLSEGRLRFR